MPVTKYVVKNPFTLSNKVYLPNQEITSASFEKNPNMESMLLKNKFIQIAGMKEPVVEAPKKEEEKPLPVKKMELPKAIEIVDDNQLKRVVEKAPEPPKAEPPKVEEKLEVKPVEAPEQKIVEETPIVEEAPRKGRIARK